MEAQFMLITFYSYFCLQQVSLPNGHSVPPFLGWVYFYRFNYQYYYSALAFNPFSAITMPVFLIRGGNPFATVKLRPTFTNDRSAPNIWWDCMQPLPWCEVLSQRFCLYWLMHCRYGRGTKWKGCVTSSILILRVSKNENQQIKFYRRHYLWEF